MFNLIKCIENNIDNINDTWARYKVIAYSKLYYMSFFNYLLIYYGLKYKIKKVNINNLNLRILYYKDLFIFSFFFCYLTKHLNIFLAQQAYNNYVNNSFDEEHITMISEIYAKRIYKFNII